MLTQVLLPILTLFSAADCAAAEDIFPEPSETASSIRHSPNGPGHYGMGFTPPRFFSKTKSAANQPSAKTPVANELPNNLALVYALNGNYDEALEKYERVLLLDQNNAELVAGRADVLSWKGELGLAAEGYEKLVRRAPDNDGYWLKLAQLYALQGRTREALSGYERVLSLNPANIDAHIGAANAYRDNRRHAEAEKVLRNGLTRFPDNARLSNELARLALKQSRGLKEILNMIEAVIFSAILLVLAREMWREHGTLRGRRLAGRMLLTAMLALLLTAIVYVNVFGGVRYKEISDVAQLLELVTLGALVAPILLGHLAPKRAGYASKKHAPSAA